MELTDNDKQRIEQEARRVCSHLTWGEFMKGAEYEHKHQREQQSSAIKELSEFKEAARRQSLELYKLEAERSELREVIQLALNELKAASNLIPITSDTITRLENSLKTK